MSHRPQHPVQIHPENCQMTKSSRGHRTSVVTSRRRRRAARIDLTLDALEARTLLTTSLNRIHDLVNPPTELATFIAGTNGKRDLARARSEGAGGHLHFIQGKPKATKRVAHVDRQEIREHTRVRYKNDLVIVLHRAVVATRLVRTTQVLTKPAGNVQQSTTPVQTVSNQSMTLQASVEIGPTSSPIVAQETLNVQLQPG